MNVGVGNQLIALEERLANELLLLELPQSVAYVYNPISYAVTTHTDYISRYANSTPKRVMFLGMNPGPFGMGQTGVPFGEVSSVKTFLNVSGDVGRPSKEHPNRPILGFDCKRKEVSGERFWSLFRTLCHSPDNFAQNCIVYNHCPLLFMTKSGKNVTPPDMPIATRKAILKLCDETLICVIELYKVEHIVGLGRYAEARAKAVVKDRPLTNVNVHFMVHPSPASAVANRGWSELAIKSLNESGIIDLVKGTLG